MGNAKRLERQLDNLFLRDLKLHVNLSKHDREQKLIKTMKNKPQSKEEAVTAKVSDRDNDKGKGITNQRTTTTGGQQHSIKNVIGCRTYANVVAIGRNYGTKKWTPKPAHANSIPSCSSVQLTIQLDKKPWLTNTWVGRLKNLVMFDRLKEEFMWDRGEEIKPKYIGGDMVLLMGISDTRAE